MIIADFLTRLEDVHQTRRGWTARCPAHADRRPSLSVAVGRDDRILVRCHAGCTPEEITHSVGLDLRDLFPDTMPTSEPRRPRDARREVVQQFLRQPWNRRGNLLHYAIPDRIRVLRQRADMLRRAVSDAGDTEAAWTVAAHAAQLDRHADTIEDALAEAIATC